MFLFFYISIICSNWPWIFKSFHDQKNNFFSPSRPELILKQNTISNFSCMFLNPNNFFQNLNYNFSNLFNVRNLQEQVKKALCYQKLFWPFTVWINCSGDFKIFANSRPSASNFKSFSWSLKQFIQTRSEQFLVT